MIQCKQSNWKWNKNVNKQLIKKSKQNIPDNSTSKSSTVSLQSKCWLRFNHKSWSSTFSINQDLLHSIFLHLEFSQGWKFTQPAKRQDKFIPIGILLPNLLTDGKESIASNLQGLVTIGKNKQKINRGNTWSGKFREIAWLEQVLFLKTYYCAISQKIVAKIT